MIHYHGVPITPEDNAVRVLCGRHAMVSFANSEQIDLVADICQTFALDNGAFSAWRSGTPISDWSVYYDFVRAWSKHPSFDFALIPDVIDGSEFDNDVLTAGWRLGKEVGVPIWHMHESLDRLSKLISYWPRIAVGSSGKYASIGNRKWWSRISEAMKILCPHGYPLVKIHGLRMLDPEVFTRIPFSSADSTNVARNLNLDSRWRGTYLPSSRWVRGVVLAERIEAHQSCPRWEDQPSQIDLDLPA